MLVQIFILAIIVLVVSAVDVPDGPVSTDHKAICSNLKALLDLAVPRGDAERLNEDALAELIEESNLLTASAAPSLANLRLHFSDKSIAELELHGEPLRCPACSKEHHGDTNRVVEFFRALFGQASPAEFRSLGELKDFDDSCKSQFDEFAQAFGTG